MSLTADILPHADSYPRLCAHPLAAPPPPPPFFFFGVHAPFPRSTNNGESRTMAIVIGVGAAFAGLLVGAGCMMLWHRRTQGREFLQAGPQDFANPLAADHYADGSSSTA